MEFPQKLMTISQLAEMGWSPKLVRRIAIEQGFPLAIREGGKTSSIKIDTDEFWKYIKMTNKIRERR